MSLRALLLAFLLALPFAVHAAEPPLVDSKGGLLARSEFDQGYERSGPTRQPLIGYVDLEDYINGRFDELRRELSLRFELSQVAIEKAEAATAIHFANINGLNQRLEEQAANLVSKAEFQTSQAADERERAALGERIKLLESAFNRQEGAASQSSVLWAMGAAIFVAVVVSMALRYVTPRPASRSSR